MHLFWIISRAAGTAALLFSSASVGLGLMMGARLLKRRGADLRITHEALSLATLVAIAVHAAVLLGDSFLHPSVADITIPFASSYRAPWIAMGIVGGWMLVLLGLSYYWRGRIGVERWRRLHRFTALAWVLGIAHALGAGTDARTTWFVIASGIVVVPTALLLAARWLSADSQRRPSALSAPAPKIGA
jgi:DMSO/TMAO reductase YedYZ heme-binding membrane subunit